MPCKCCIKCNKVNCVQNEEINKQTKWTTKNRHTHTITNEAEDEANPYSYIYWTRNKCHTKSELPRRSTVRWKEKGHRKYHAHDENRIFYLSQWFIFYDPHHHKSKQFIFTGHKAASKSALDIFQFLCHFFVIRFSCIASSNFQSTNEWQKWITAKIERFEKNAADLNDIFQRQWINAV